MIQNIKFKYENRQVIFFVLWRGAQVEVLRATATLELEQIKRLKQIAQFKANDLLNVLKQAA